MLTSVFMELVHTALSECITLHH